MSAVERFRAAVARRLGLELDQGKAGLLDEVLRERVRATGSGDPETYLGRLEGPGKEEAETRALAEQLTINETYFFRHGDSLRAFALVAVPELLRRGPRLRVLSAGCSSGEEPYSLVMTLREQGHDAPGTEIAVVGVDVNPAALRKAREGVYTVWSLRDTPPHLRTRYFRPLGGQLQLDPEIRARVVFEERNLIEEDPSFFHPGAFDAIFCRNVTIYFAPETTRRLMARLARALTPGGYLFLGHSENLRGISDDFELCQSHGVFYYRRRDGELAPPASPPVPRAPAPLDGTAWLDSIERATARIARLTDEPAAAAPAPAPSWDLAPVLSCLEQERFAEALTLLGALPAEAARESQVQLLRAVALVNAGNVADAERVCGELLVLDELNAGAHYLMALCREQAGDRHGAARHDQTAVMLAPEFAMPHLHLGLLARRAGDGEEARRQLETARALLAREEAGRILLFGGGFSRAALTELCVSELRGVGRR